MLDSNSVDLTLTGDGSGASPYSIRADLSTAPNPGGTLPPGSTISYAGDTAPAGWIMCDGRAVARVEFSALFAIIGTKYGIGDNVSTYNVPDLRGRAIIGAGSGAGLTIRNLAAKGGQQDAVVASHGHGSHDHGLTGGQSLDHTHGGTTAGQSASHTHLTAADVTGVQTGGGGSRRGGSPAEQTGGASNDHVHNFGTGGASQGHQHGVGAAAVPTAGVSPTDANMPPWMALNMIIKT